MYFKILVETFIIKKLYFECYVINMYNETFYVKHKCKNWAAEIKNMLSSIGQMNLWENQLFEKPEII